MRPIFLGEINALTASICLRRETKNQWERRVALIPDAVSRLIAKGVEIDVATSPNRIFSDQAYREAGARVVAVDIDVAGDDHRGPTLQKLADDPFAHFAGTAGYQHCCIS